MLSICIPVFNFSVCSLVEELHRQAERLDVPAEILLIDDGSDISFKSENSRLAGLKLVRYEELRENTGRSKIRNMLAQKARYPLLLFLDCDICINDADFLRKYINAGKDGSVVCGGHVYQERQPDYPYSLHWRFGKYREAKPPELRQKRPHHSFMTASFLVPAHVIYQMPFNEELNGYGHEDTLYGYQLLLKGIPVKHIDNPVLHTGLDTADTFLTKTRQGIYNLLKVYELTGYDQSFLEMVKVLKTCNSMKAWMIRKPFLMVYRLMERYLEKNLTGNKPRIWMLDIYKLGIICR